MYHGKNGADASLCGTFQAVTDIQIGNLASTPTLQFKLTTYYFSKVGGCWKPVEQYSDWHDTNLTFQNCPSSS